MGIHRDRSRLALGLPREALIASSLQPIRLTDAIPCARAATNQRPKPAPRLFRAQLRLFDPVTARSLDDSRSSSKTLAPADGSPNLALPPTFVACLAFTHLNPRPGFSSKPRGVRLQPNLSFVPGRCHIHPERTLIHPESPFQAVSRPTHSTPDHSHAVHVSAADNDNKSHILGQLLPFLLNQPDSITHNRACLSRRQPSTTFTSPSTLSISLSTSLSTPLRQSPNGPPFPGCLKPASGSSLLAEPSTRCQTFSRSLWGPPSGAQTQTQAKSLFCLFSPRPRSHRGPSFHSIGFSPFSIIKKKHGEGATTDTTNLLLPPCH